MLSGRGELVAAVRGTCDSFLQELSVAVPVGKDSLSMRAQWSDDKGQDHVVSAPVTCVAAAYGHTDDASATLTPYVQRASRYDLNAFGC